MADKKISQLTNLAPALNTDQLPINRGGVSGKLTVSEILTPEATLRANADGDLSTLTTTNQSDLVSAINEVNGELPNKIPTSYLDTDTSLTANSDSKIATQKATRAYVLANVTPAATESVAGKAEIATQTETNTGTDDTRFITPLKLKTNLTSLGYLGGAGTANYLPKYTASNTLGNSAIQQSATGNRILLNGVSDDTATALQVNGAIRQTLVTSKIAALDANGKIIDGGSGSANYITKFSSTNTVTQSLIRDDNTSVAINNAPDGISQLYSRSTSLFAAIRGVNSFISGGSDVSYGIVANAIGANTAGNIGLSASANTSPTSNIAGQFIASGTGSYALQLQDGTQAAGKFLKSIDATGKANWANIASTDIATGFSGVSPYLARWTGTNTLGNSTVTDNGSQVGIGNAPLSNSKLFVATSNTLYSLNSSNSSTTGITYGVYSTTTGSKANQNIGIGGFASNSSTENTGVVGSAVVATAGLNVGGYFIASNGGTNYSLQLRDGTEGTGKFLKSVTATGQSNWANIAISDISTYYTTSTTLTSANLLSLGTTPITLVAAPGANKSIWVKRVFARINYGGTTYSSQTLVLKISGASTANNVAQESLILSSTASRYSRFLIQEDALSLANDTMIVENSPLIITTASGANPTTGNSSINIYVEYQILDFSTIPF